MQRFPQMPHAEFEVFKKLNTPVKVQDFIDTLRINFEVNRDTCRSPLVALRRKEAHCMEGALIAASIFWYHGKKPLLLDLKSARNDDDHVVALFQKNGSWGAISKTNHSVLQYRDPIYTSVRELALSYFNEYFLDSGAKTLRSYSAPFSLLQYHPNEWLTTRSNLWHISDALDTSRHFDIIKSGDTRRLRPANPLEIRASKLTRWKNGKN